MTILAWIVLVTWGAALVVGAYLIGTPREPYGRSDYLYLVVSVLLVVPLCGRVLGWW